VAPDCFQNSKIKSKIENKEKIPHLFQIFLFIRAKFVRPGNASASAKATCNKYSGHSEVFTGALQHKTSNSLPAQTTKIQGNLMGNKQV
jgi:hypothetical protein